MAQTFCTFNLDEFEEVDNVISKDTPVKFDKAVARVSNKCTFFSLIENKKLKPRFKLYYRSYWDPTGQHKHKIWTAMSPIRYHNQVTCYSISDDGVNFRKGVSNKRLGKRNILLCERSVSHNFSPFMAKGMYYAVGGRNVHKSTVDAHPHPGKCLKAIKYIKWKLTTRAQVKRSRGDMKTMTTLVVSDKIPSACMLNGLHLYRSKEGKSWKKVKNLPIISGLRNGVDLNGILGYASFDATSSVVYSDDLKRYILYQRANPATNRRYISYCTSKDLINWSKFKMLHVLDSSWKYDSFYCPYIYKAAGYYIGVLPHLVIKKELYVDGGILVMMSKDGITWRKRRHFIDFHVKNDHRPLIPKTNLYNKLLYYPVGGSLIESDDKKSLYFYIHSLKHNRIERYITRRNGLTYFCQKDFSRPAKFCTKLLTKPTQSFGLSLNFNSKPGGIILIELCDEKKQVIPGCSFSDCDPLTGDYLSKQPTWKTRKITEFPELSNFHIRFSLMNTNLFSFNLTNEIELVN